MNFLHGGRCGFRVGPSVSRCTRGVWIYGRPTAVTLGDGSTVAVVLLDTEGVGGLEADSKYFRRADVPRTDRGDAAAATRIISGDGSRRTPAATTWIVRGGDAAAVTWIFRGDE